MRNLTLCLLVTMLLVASASADVVYENGFPNGNVNAWQINFGFTVSDTFYLPEANVVSGLIFYSWLYPGDTLLSAEVSITSAENGGTVYFDQVLSAQQGGCARNNLGYSVCTEGLDFGGGGVNLNAGTYWINLSNAVATNDGAVYWDENSGVGCHSQGCPSQASENTIGTIPSESFVLVGGTGTSSTGTIPEPASILLLASGLAAAGLRPRKI
ncbi:MAG TPA: PEP-CTERM sorting domain-containing protein [Terriglobales bacterium]|nr:PEP-CTERM sorting domain-containing protein [Terriglobales bacterium]